jgi:hypothetical protein
LASALALAAHGPFKAAPAAALALAGHLDAAYDAWDVKVRDGVAFVAEADLVIGSFTGALQIFDVTSPSSPVQCALYDPDLAGAFSVALHGDFAYVGTAGIEILDVSDPCNPVLRGKLLPRPPCRG